MTPAQLTVWFDGACPLCLREITLMRRLDRQGAIDFIDIGAAGAACPIDPALLLQRFHARETDGPLLDGAAAFAAMWRAIPALRPLGHVAKWPPILWLLERAYRGFLRIRPRLQAWARQGNSVTVSVRD
jgi:predicted DCC family thiol-disulfide oxidoreductase YuxK